MGISAFVVSYNRAHLIETALASVRFADEVILVDKSSTDGTRDLAAKWADRIVTIPWSPTPGESAAYALSLCSNEWVVALADDESFNPAAIEFITEEVKRPRADIYLIPRQDHILGRFDASAYYWPQWHPQFYRRSAMAYENTVHAASQPQSQSQFRVPIESGVAIVHLSHESVVQWIEKANRYTSQPNRVRTYALAGSSLTLDDQHRNDLRAFADRVIDFWLPKSATDANGYSARVALLRAIYDLIDRVKELEENDGIDGHELFRRKCETMMQGLAAFYARRE